MTFTNRGKKARRKKWTTPISFVDIYEEVRKPSERKKIERKQVATNAKV